MSGSEKFTGDMRTEALDIFLRLCAAGLLGVVIGFGQTRAGSP